MIKLPGLIIALFVTASAFSQTTTANKTNLGNRPADHFMIQLAANLWSGTADSVDNYLKGFNRSANVYVMLNKPFKGNPKMSAAIGVGVGTANMYFNKMEVNITENKTKLPFTRTDTGLNYKKYKLATAFLEIPVELRFTANPETPNKSIKGAIGVKVGTLVNAHTKAKGLRTAGGGKINEATFKASSKSYFNTTRLSVTARAGYGIFSLFGSYGLTNVFKDGVAADTKPLQIGITISGL